MPALLEKLRSGTKGFRNGTKGSESFEGDPIAELRRLYTRFIQIGETTDRILKALAEVPQRSQVAYRAFTRACEGGGAETIERTMQAWLSIVPGCEHAMRELAATEAMKHAGSVFEAFKKECPNPRDVLQRACAARLDEARRVAETVLTQERQRLAPEGFSETEIRNSSQSKRALNAVARLERVRERIANEPIEHTFKILAPELLR